MLRLETVCYLLASLILAWGGGWFFAHDHGVAVVLCCAIWAALTVWLLVISLRAVLRSQRIASGGAETGIDLL
jgi:hypothetical protein